MFGNVVLGIDKEQFEEVITKKKKERRIKQDSSLRSNDLKDIVKKFKTDRQTQNGRAVPGRSLEAAAHGPRRRFPLLEQPARHHLSPSATTFRPIWARPSMCRRWCSATWATTRGTGVGFTRNPSTGDKEFYGEFLINAQGEDVVAGIRTPQPIAELKNEMPEVYKQLKEITDPPGKALPRRPGFRVHDRRGQAVHASDPQRQTDRRRRRSRSPWTWSRKS